MSVFTTITLEQLSAWLENYDVGELLDFAGIASGIENTNYFVAATSGRYVLTLFERLDPSVLPFYLDLLAHLAQRGILCPQPIANAESSFLGALNGKPASLVTFLPGSPVNKPTTQQCAAVGNLLAQMHLAAADYQARMPNPRGPQWSRAALQEVTPFLDADAAALLGREVELYVQQGLAALPQGVIHADLFRDNVLWNGARMGGVIDFYFACNDALIYDVAIAVNDWCLQADATLHSAHASALLAAYHRIRPFTADERDAWPLMLRAGALRFWMSRLYDLHLPRPGELTYAKDPQHFRRILEQHIAHEPEIRRSFVT